MVKRFLSLVLVLALSLTMFTFVDVSAAQDITLEIAGAPYSKYTIAGTVINTTSVASLSAGQEVVYFLNGVEAGRANAAGNFNFTSVDGTNNLQAKIVEGGAVVAESNVVELDFVPLYRAGTIKSSPLSTLENSNVFTNGVHNNAWVTYTEDPDENCTGTVMHVAEPTPAADRVAFSLSASSTGIERIDFKFYGEHYIGGLYAPSINLSCGCGYGTYARIDWPSGTALDTSRKYVYPKKKWIDVTMVINSYAKSYDLYADGVQVISAQTFCKNAAHTAVPTVNAIQLFSPGWAGTITVGTDSAGNAIKEKHHGEFYMKDLEYYSCKAAEVAVTAPSSAIIGNKVAVSVSEKFVDGMKYVYSFNGVESDPTDDQSFIVGPVNAGENTLIVKAVKDGEVLATSEPTVINGYLAPNESAFELNPTNAAGYGLSTDAQKACYSYVDLEETYPGYGMAHKLETASSGLSFYPQNGLNPVNNSGCRNYFSSGACVNSDCITISYDLNVTKLGGTITNSLDYYYKAQGDLAAGEKYPGVMNISNGTITMGIAPYSASMPFSTNDWINIKYVFSRQSQTAYFMADGVVLAAIPFSKMPGRIDPFGGNVMFIIFAAGTNNTSYIDNITLGYGIAPTVTLTAVSENLSAPAGTKVPVTAALRGLDNVKYNYYVNGNLYDEKSSSNVSYAPVSAGLNTVYVEAVDDNGAVFVTSEPITFNGYADTFEMALHRDVSTSIFARHNKHVPTSTEYKDFGDIGYENDTTKFASDANYQNTLKISSGLAGEAGNLINILTYYAGRKPNAAAMANANRLYTQSLDVYPENITAGSLALRLYYPSSKTRETAILNSFVFGTDSISVATARNGSTSVSVPYTQGKWYNVKAIFDPMAGKIMLAVNDVIYSVIDESATEYAPLALNNELASNCLYFDITLNGSGVEEPNVVYLDNNDFEYSVIPAYTPVQYTNGGNVIANRSQISSESDLVINFTVNKGEFANILCIATVLENNGELVCIDTENVTFEGDATSDDVTLTLTNLPASIAAGGYTVNVMLWDPATQEPIVKKVVLPN